MGIEPGFAYSYRKVFRREAFLFLKQISPPRNYTNFMLTNVKSLCIMSLSLDKKINKTIPIFNKGGTSFLTAKG